MRIAVPLAGGRSTAHCGRCEAVAFVDEYAGGNACHH